MQSLHMVSWLAVRGKAVEAICNDLALRQGMASIGEKRRFAIEGAPSDAGWYLIVAQGFDHRLIQPEILATLSTGCEVLTCTADESNLSAAATGWRNGQRQWSITYEGEDVPGEVTAEGELPRNFEFVRQDYVARSQAEDAGDLLLDPLFEIPIETVHREIGFRPDEPSPAFAGRFVLLEATNPTLKQRLFGG